jgi:methyl-accepting chemotaxis protein
MKFFSNKIHNKKFKGLSRTLLNIMAISIVCAVAITATVSLVSTNTMISNITNKQATDSANVMKKELNNTSKTLEISSKMISINQTVINEILAKNSIAILKESENLKEMLGLDNITITDSKGSILSSTSETKKVGDNISNKIAIKNALDGNTHSIIDGETNSKYAVNVTVPVKNETGNIIGTVTTSYNLDNPDLVDNLKQITGDEFTIFEVDKRINTTIIIDGERVVGTDLDQDIVDIVINQMHEYTGKAKLFNKNYITAYLPILSNDQSKVTGIIFAGRDNTDVEHALFINILLVVIITIISVLINILIVLSILKKRMTLPLEKVVDAAKSIEFGDISDDVVNSIIEITSKDEIGSLAKSMKGAIISVRNMSEDIGMYQKALVEHDLTFTASNSNHNGVYKSIIEIVGSLFSELGLVMNEIKIMADGIEMGSYHVSAASQSLAQGSTQQASATEQLASTIEDISQQLSENANNANTARSISIDTTSEVKISNTHMNEMMKSMSNINSISIEIRKIIKTIDEIAFQTNILALNAAVEAARAGIHGKGFAVVADEVRNLANKSASAAKDTTILIGKSIKAVEEGSKIAKITETTLQNVVYKTNEVNDIVSEISETTKKLSEGMNQISIGICQVSDVVQTNSATSEETAASSEELSAQAQSLHEMVNVYKMKN